MNQDTIVRRASRRFRRDAMAVASRAIEPVYLSIDKAQMRRNRNLRLVPRFGHRRGGKISYGEWCWLVGLLQTLIHDAVDGIDSPRIVDLGCGTGLAIIAAEPATVEGGEVIGLDVRSQDVDFCRRHFPSPQFRFELLDSHNRMYAPGSQKRGSAWPIDDESADLVTAVSVLTHLDESDCRDALAEMARVLRPDGHAIVTAFLINEGAELPRRDELTRSRFHRTAPWRWSFSRALGNGWFTTEWATVAEEAIGVDRAEFTRACADAGLDVVRVIDGTWPEKSGLYFQDIVILRSL